MDSYIIAFVKLNNTLYTVALFVLIFASLAGWKKTRNWVFLAFTLALAMPLVRSLVMSIYAYTALKGLADSELTMARVHVLRVKVWTLQIVNLVEFALLTLGGLGILFAKSSQADQK